MGGKSTTKGGDVTTTQVTETTSVGIQGNEGLAVAGGGDVNVSLETTDLGAVQGAFDFTQDFSDSAFEFANDVSRQASRISEQAVETSQIALASVATGGQSDLSKIDQKTIGLAIAAIAAIFVLPQVFRRAS